MFQTEVTQPDTLSHILEIVSSVSDIVVAVVAVIALIQIFYAKRQLTIAAEALDVARKDIEVRVNREGIVLAASLVEKFGREIVISIVDRFNRIEAEVGKLSKWTITNDRFEETSLEGYKGFRTWVGVLRGNPAHLADLIKSLNELESYAIYFAEGAADEKVAYPSTGVVFCAYVEILAPVLIHIRGNKTAIQSGPFQNTIKLYNQWAARIKKQELDEQATKLLTESARISVGEMPIAGAAEIRQKQR